MEKRKKRVISAVLTLALIMGIFAVSPVNVNAAAIGTGADLEDGPDLTGTQVYFGNNIKWYVVDTDEGKNTATLFSSNRFSGAYDDDQAGDPTHGNWVDSDICKWLNSDERGWTLDSESVYRSDTLGFLNRAFSVSEAAAIAIYGTTDAAVEDYINDIQIPEIDVSQKIVLPSYEETKNGGTWGFSSKEARDIGGSWWLRSYNNRDSRFAYIFAEGDFLRVGVFSKYGIFPTLKLDLSSVLFTSDADKAIKTVSGSSLAKISGPPTLAALTLTDSGLSLDAATTGVSGATGGSVKIAYENATTGPGMGVSVLICDGDDEMLYYGRPVDLSAGDPSGSGTATVKIPDDLDLGDYTVKIFSEKVNDSNRTDYASEPEEVGLSVIEPAESTVTFDKNGGDDISFVTSKAISGEPYDFPVATRAGYTLDGWTTALSGGALVTSGSIVTETTDHSLYANWKANEYTVTFSAVDADSVGMDTKTVTYDDEYGTLPLATKAGYTFNGWYDRETGGNMISESTKVKTAGNHYLYAAFTKDTPAPKNYTVFFNVNGGQSLSTDKKTVTQGKKYGSLPIPKRTGHAFKGWYTAGSGGSKITSATTVNLTKNQTLYAQWTANKYNVVFMGNKGKIKKDGKYKAGSLTKKISYGNEFGTLPKAKRTGYTLIGWYTKKTGGEKVTAETKMITARTTKLYARWSPNAKIVNCKSVNLRKGPGKSKAVKGYVKKGAKVSILKTVKFGKHKWHKVIAGTRTGYIYAKYVKRV